MHETKNIVEIFSDGACSGNPGPGGWGAVLRYNSKEKQISGNAPATTNNRMELTAVIEALKILKKPCQIKITTDSKYVCTGMTEWLPQWKVRGWRTANKEPVKNVDLWQQLDKLTGQHQITWHWIKGHNGHKENEIADSLATRAIEKVR